MLIYGKKLKFINNEIEETIDDNSIGIKEVTQFDFLIKKHNFCQLKMHNRKVCLYGDINWTKKYEPKSLVFEVENLITCYFRRDDPILYFFKHSNYQEEKNTFWIYHTILPLFLMIQEYYEAILHGGSIEIDGKAILFIASPMSGKSTLIDYFISKGHPMIADDRVAISQNNGIYQATSSYPYCRPYREFEDLGKLVHNVTDSPLPICAIYILGRAEKNEKVEIFKVKGIERFQLLAQSHEVNFSYQKPKVLNVLANMANSIPLYKLSIPWNLERLDEVYEETVNHSRLIMRKR